MSHASRITTKGTIFTQAFFSVSHETSPNLVTLFLSNKWWKVSEKNFCPVDQVREGKREEKTTRTAIAKLFALQVNAINMKSHRISPGGNHILSVTEHPLLLHKQQYPMFYILLISPSLNVSRCKSWAPVNVWNLTNVYRKIT